LRVVTELPLSRLWDAEGDIEAIRERWLTRDSLQQILRKYPVEFIIADVGQPLRQVTVARCYEFWKSEVERHLAPDPETGFRLEDFPGLYAYCASEWSGEIMTPIVLLEKHH
jgi:hypothetical protein